MKNNDETILEILQGHKTTRWPTPRIMKIFISGAKSGKCAVKVYSLSNGDIWIVDGNRVRGI